MPSLTGFDQLLKTSEPLAPHTWLRTGGAAQYFASPTTVDDLASLVVRCRAEGLETRLLGGGSNILVRDEGVTGVVIQLTGAEFSAVDIQGNVVRAGAAAKLGHVVSQTVSAGLGGMETLVGIPGTIGGALHGNAGGRGGDIGQWASAATVLTHSGELVQHDRNDLVFAYRESSLDELVILGGEFTLEPADPEELTRRMQKQWIMKKAGQPLGHQSAGCIFKNPRGMSAGMLIDQAGLKGVRSGGAEVSQRHANFIVTDETATSTDVLRLIDTVRDQVRDRLGVELELEIDIW